MNKPNVYYKESGIANPINLSFSIICSLLVILFFSFFYSLFITYLPIIYFNFIIVVIYGFIVSFVSRIFNAIFKIRNRKKVVIVTTLLAIFAVYFQWVSYLFIISLDSFTPKLLFTEFNYFISILFRPDLVVYNIVEISKTGLWSLGISDGAFINGIFLWLIWLVEAGIIIFVSWNNFQNFSEIPFSEKDNKWFKKEFIDFDFEHIAFKKKFIEEFIDNPSETISNLKRGDGIRHSKISIFRSDTEPKSLIAIDNIIITQRGKGKKDVTKVLEYCYIDNLHLMKLRDKFRIKKASIFDY